MKAYCRLYYRIPFSETDAMGIVHHSNHARYLERGRIEFLRLAGLDYAGIMKRGFHYPVTELNIEFKRPLVFDEVIMIETEVSELTRTRLNFAYNVFSVTELLPATMETSPYSGATKVSGESFHCCVNDDGRPVAGNAEFLERIKQLFGGPGS